MNFAKHKEECRETVFKMLIEIGAIETCDYHDDFYYNTYRYTDEEILLMVTSKAKEKYGEIQDETLFQELTKEILSDAATGADECPYCQKNK